MHNFTKKRTVLGQDPAILLALWANVLSWAVRTFAPSLLPRLLPACEQEDVACASPSDDVSSPADDRRTKCISIGRPGGIEQLRVIWLKPGIMTCGYNVPHQDTPFTAPSLREFLPPDCVVLRNLAFSVNYADCCIRWGLYESAKQFVGYPIVPGFDVAGIVENAGSDTGFQPGDRVFGCSLFGAYSSRVLVPAVQLRRIPTHLSTFEAAALPAVSLTALYALFLAGQYPVPERCRSTNRAILIHSAAGGVGSMLVQMARLLGLHPVVGVVGRTTKVDAARALGCDVVIDKSRDDLWEAVRIAAPDGYVAVMDSNGVSTLADSYEHLAMTGRLIVFGFHTNLPMGRDALSPWEWLTMARKARHMPAFDPMEMGQSNRGVLAFNLSFFATERAMLADLFDQVLEWLEDGALQCPRIVEMTLDRVAEAHELIQSGSSVGKIVLTTGDISNEANESS